ncbi:MAG: thioredoxin family protein [Fusobacteriaceae bacterium]
MNLREFYDVGMNFEMFVGTGSRSERDRIPKNYSRISLSDEQIEKIKKFGTVKFLIVGEIWCFDVQLNSSVVRKFCEINHNFDMRVITKGRGEKFLKPMLELENIKIPLILILNEEGELLGKFHERPETVKAHSDFQEIKMEYFKGAYLKDTVKELIEILEKSGI